MVAPEISEPGVQPLGEDADRSYAVNAEDNITLLASKIIRDVLVTRGEPIRRAQLWSAVELAMGKDRSPDVDGVLKRDWFSNQETGPGQWRLTDDANAGGSPFADAAGRVNLASVVKYLRLCRQGEAPYIGDVGDFIKICRPNVELDVGWLVGRSLASG